MVSYHQVMKDKIKITVSGPLYQTGVVSGSGSEVRAVRLRGVSCKDPVQSQCDASEWGNNRITMFIFVHGWGVLSCRRLAQKNLSEWGIVSGSGLESVQCFWVECRIRTLGQSHDDKPGHCSESGWWIWVRQQSYYRKVTVHEMHRESVLLCVRMFIFVRLNLNREFETQTWRWRVCDPCSHVYLMLPDPLPRDTR